MGDLLEKHMTRVPIDKAVKPFDGAYVYCDRWWTVENDCILFYRGSPQCNADRRIAESFRDRMYPGADVRLLPVVYMPNER